MDIGHTRGGRWELDAEAMRAVILGKITWKRCFSCDKGLVWVDGDEGIEVSQEFVDSNQSKENEFRFYQDTCEDCIGVGFVFIDFGD